MKLKNKKTGEIVPASNIAVGIGKDGKWYDSLAELNSEWEDYEEPEEYWFIDYDGGIIPFSRMKETATDRMMKQIGNYFDSREEAEKAVEKLKAWKRLKDKGFRFEGWEMDGTIWFETKQDEQEWSPKYRDDLDLLFSQEDD